MGGVFAYETVDTRHELDGENERRSGVADSGGCVEAVAKGPASEGANGEEIGVAAIGERAEEGGAEGHLGEGAEWLAVVITPHLGAVLGSPGEDVAVTVW